jgi:hypothetical protein
MNDINAACGSAMTVVEPRGTTRHGPPDDSSSVESRLAQLEGLRKKGLIDGQERTDPGFPLIASRTPSSPPPPVAAGTPSGPRDSPRAG